MFQLHDETGLPLANDTTLLQYIHSGAMLSVHSYLSAMLCQSVKCILHGTQVSVTFL